jgi:predicted AAA+ superfamily ATPase
LAPFDLQRVLERGTIPSHYLSSSYQRHLEAYVQDYLTLEIQQGSLVRNLPAFQHFLEMAAFSCGEVINYANIAREGGVNEKTIKSYFDILEDSLVGHRLPPFAKKQKRDLIFKSNKFYFFDIGLMNTLKRNASSIQTMENKGQVLESYIFQELNAYRLLQEDKKSLSFWRTTKGVEVDFILDNQIAIEVKLSNNIHHTHLKGLGAFAEENPAKELILVCLEDTPRLVTYKNHQIKIFPMEEFLKRLWGGEFV